MVPKPDINILNSAFQIWDDGEFISATSHDGREAGLYLYQNEYYLIWYNGVTVDNVEKIDKSVVEAMFPKSFTNI